MSNRSSWGVVMVFTLLLLALPTHVRSTTYAHVWLGSFYQYSDRYGDSDARLGNVAVVVEAGVAGRMRKPVIVPAELLHESVTPVVAVFVHARDVDEADSLSRPLLSHGGIPVLGYVDHGDWTECPTVPDWVGVMAYRRSYEGLGDWDTRTRRMLNSCRSKGKRIAIVAQTYDTNTSLHNRVDEQFQYYYAWAREYHAIAVLAFSDGRSFADCSFGGMRCRPQWAAQWDAMVRLLAPWILGPPAAPTGLRIRVQTQELDRPF